MIYKTTTIMRKKEHACINVSTRNYKHFVTKFEPTQKFKTGAHLAKVVIVGKHAHALLLFVLDHNVRHLCNVIFCL